MRFPVIQRVDYTIDDRATFNFSTDVSAAGLFLRNAKDLEVGQQIELRIALKNREQPACIRGVVRRVATEGGEIGVGIEFVEGQSDSIALLREFIDREVVSRLEDTVARSLGSATNVAQLAAYYMEAGRGEKAADLCRRGLLANAGNQRVYETLVGILLAYVEAQGIDAVASIGEIEDFVQHGLALGPSDILDAYRERVVRLRVELDRRQQEHQREQMELRQREISQQAQLAREVMEHELATLRSALEAKHATSAQQDAQQREKLQAELAQRDRQITQLREQLAAAGAELDAAKTELSAQSQRAQTFSNRLENLDAVRTSLVDQVEAIRRSQGALEQDLRQSRESLASLRGDHARLTEDRDALAEQVGRMHEQRASLEHELQQVRETLAKLEGDHARLDEERSQLVEKLRRERADLVAARLERESTQQRSVETEKQLDTLRRELALLRVATEKHSPDFESFDTVVDTVPARASQHAANVAPPTDEDNEIGRRATAPLSSDPDRGGALARVGKWLRVRFPRPRA